MRAPYSASGAFAVSTIVVAVSAAFVAFLGLGLGLGLGVAVTDAATTTAAAGSVAAADDAPATSTRDPELADRGNQKVGDRCNFTQDCGFAGSECNAQKKCTCIAELPVSNHIDKCGKEAAINESCTFNAQCEATTDKTECRDGRCVCRFELTPSFRGDGNVECIAVQNPTAPVQYVDPAMIGVLVGMALMFIIICVVLRLFSKARWRENRTIFNTPNPRLMNVSLLRDSKLLHDRRNSRGSVRGPSRQPSMASLRPHSPNSQGSRRGSKGSSNGGSATSLRSNRSPPGGAPTASASAATTPMLESVTVEVQQAHGHGHHGHHGHQSHA